MAVTLTHATVATGTNAGNGEIAKEQWNEGHSLSMATGKLLGRTSSGAGSAEELSAGAGLVLGSGTLKARSGDTSTSSAVDITLTSSSDLIQRVTMTAAGKKVTLPDATTMNEGEFFLIVNTGDNLFSVCTNGGTVIAYMQPSKAYTFWINSNATAAGVWTISDAGSDPESRFGASFAETLLTASMAECRAAKLSTTKMIVVYSTSADYYGKAVIVDISGTDLTWGTPITFASERIYFPRVGALSATKAIVCWEGASPFPGNCCVLDVSGSTITAATTAVFDADCASNIIELSILSSSKALVCYDDAGNSGYGTARILDVSGSTITVGTAAVFESGSTTDVAVATISSTKAIVTYLASQIKACILDVSGSTITPATAFAYSSLGSVPDRVCALSSTQAVSTVFGGTGDTTVYLHFLNISGSTITSNTDREVGISTTYTGLLNLSATEVVVAHGTAFTELAIYNKNKERGVSRLNISTYLGIYGDILVLDANKIIIISLDAGFNTVQGVIVEYVA